ncbi:hypothetical protein [Mycobacterium paraintracellulare]|uniref:hypothetical protein n=1 Tax=Mycobacterium paraintracellulare TaxID=1138383 RepID=UPI0019296FDD|nr:hypothetical protein [Mycobacterium paraintracellulare]BCP14838.1 hypothetical protein MINTM021_17470 [Mycobacterium paraintracellulare]
MLLADGPWPWKPLAAPLPWLGHTLSRAWFFVWHAWIHLWQNISPSQGTMLGGAFVIIAAVIAFGTGELNRRARDNQFHYQELKALYSESLNLASQYAVLHRKTTEERLAVQRQMTEKMQQIQTALSLTGDYMTSELLLNFMQQEIGRSMLKGIVDYEENKKIDAVLTNQPVQQPKWRLTKLLRPKPKPKPKPQLRVKGSVTREQMMEFGQIIGLPQIIQWATQNINSWDVLQRCREELSTYLPIWSRHRYTLRRDIRKETERRDRHKASVTPGESPSVQGHPDLTAVIRILTGQ